jgi:uncharacterized protein YaeQ
MALKATIFKADLQIADMDRNYYQPHSLTLARHPSETDERMMVRLLAFALHADEALSFTKGLSTDDEPDLWRKELSGEIDLWIDIGQPDEKRIRKACGRAKQVVVYCYSSRSAAIWWEQNSGKLQRFENLKVINIQNDASKQLAALAQRNMQLQCTIQDGQVWLGDDVESLQVDLGEWKP